MEFWESQNGATCLDGLSLRMFKELKTSTFQWFSGTQILSPEQGITWANSDEKQLYLVLNMHFTEGLLYMHTRTIL